VVALAPENGRVRFGVFELDTKAGQLSKNGIRVKLSQQPLLVLSVLVARPGEVISRKDLHKLLWSSDVFVDFDHGLNKSIQKLRDALGDSPESPRYIETIPRTGYRFIAPVTETNDRPTHAEVIARTPELTTNPSVARDSIRTWGWLALGSCAAIIALAVTWLAVLRYTPAKPIHSLAVIPLDNLSGDPAQEYFADGMTDELITMLAKDSTLRIVSRTSVMQYKGARRPLPEIGRALGVDGILEGSISRSDNQVHLTLQLIRADTDAHLWAESYDRTGNDVAALPGEAARDVASRLHSTVASTSPAHPVSSEAHDAYLRGWYFLEKREADKSAAYFQRAVSIDPSWSQAYSGLAEAVQSEGVLSMMPQTDAVVKTEAAARRAIELDPQNGQAYSTLGLTQGVFEWSWAEAEENLKRGAALSPSNSNVQFEYANYLVAVNRPEEAVLHMRRALELDPQSFMMNRHLGTVLYLARHYDEALTHLKQAEEMEPGKRASILGWRSLIYEKTGMQDKAVDSALLSLAMFDADSAKKLRSVYQRDGWNAYWKARMKMMLAHENDFCATYDIATNYVRLGKSDLAFPRIKAAIEQKCWAASWLMADPMMDGIRNDPRYNDLLRSMNLPH
jgi:TolB-like protein/DNA-binding winged helix-turn-helix (wHTH) protein/cytochrome c-type biogenesis protein CcmH/NrfG